MTIIRIRAFMEALLEASMYVCLCHGVTENTIRSAVAEGVRSLEELSARTGCGTCCGCCRDLASQLLSCDSQPQMQVLAA